VPANCSGVGMVPIAAPPDAAALMSFRNSRTRSAAGMADGALITPLICPVQPSRAKRIGKLLALFADTQLTDDIPVAVGVIRLEIIEQTAAFADQH
jgi:hypothetical protein